MLRLSTTLFFAILLSRISWRICKSFKINSPEFIDRQTTALGILKFFEPLEDRLLLDFDHVYDFSYSPAKVIHSSS